VTWPGADDFERLSWHDCPIRGIELRVGDPDAGDWTSDLALDIDYIAEWLCPVGGGGQFRVAPATLVFHGVTDLRIAIDWGDTGHQVALHDATIDRIERERVAAQKVYLDRPYYRWRIALNWPRGGELRFGAVGLTQTLRAEPVLTDRQRLPPGARGGAAGR
jgi:hypothetical protein